jgi:nicotinamidase-related amidase
MKKYAVISVDMHRGYLDPEVATMPLPAERCKVVIDNTASLFQRLREWQIPIIHVVAGFRNAQEALSNPHWRANDEDPKSVRKAARRHNMQGSVGTEIIPALYRDGDYVVRNKKRYNCFHMTDLEFVLKNLGVDTVIITGINTSSCCLSTSFEATNRDYGVIMVEDCMDSMDGRDFHDAAIKIMKRIIGQVVTSGELVKMMETTATGGVNAARFAAQPAGVTEGKRKR